jgi:excisionase family DNA binding protein
VKTRGELVSMHSANRAENAARSFQPQPQTEWLTVNEAADYLRVKARTLLLWTRQGKIRGYALSGTRRRVWRYLRSELDAAVLGRPVLCSISPSVLVTKGERE